MRAQIRMFGRFTITQPGSEAPIPGRKACAMLAYLLLSPGGTATRERLCHLLWTDRGPEQARASLRQALRELRDNPVLADAVRADRHVVSLEEHAFASDLHGIHAAAEAGDLAALALALDQVRGDFLEDLSDLSPGFDEWLLPERERQHEILVTEALAVIERGGAQGGFANVKDARNILRSLDRLDPLNEAVARFGMRLDHAEGDSASLHRRYRRLSEQLDRELGVLPSDETRQLYNRLLTGPQAASGAPIAASAHAPPASPSSRASEGGGEGGSEEIGAPGSGEDMVPLVMVAPIVITGGDETLASMSAFCADDVRTSLSWHRGIRVLAVDDKDIPQALDHAGNALGIYLLSWSMLQMGASLRLNMQLVNGASRVIIWSESLRFDTADENMMHTIVEKASGAVVPAIDRDLDRQLRQSAASFRDERSMYTRARLLIRRVAHLDAVREAVDLLERIVAENPRHLGAHLLLVRMYSTDFWQQMAGHDVAKFRALSDEHLRAAAAIEPDNCEVRIRQGWAHLRAGMIDAARREFEKAQDRLPRDADLINMCAFGMCHIGLLDDCARLMQRAFFINPFPPSDYHADYAVMLALRGEAEAAEEHFAVSGESGLQYAAVRIANAGDLDGGTARVADCLENFAPAFHQAWQQAEPPVLEDVLEWIGNTMPFHPPDRMEWVRSGLRRMLAPLWPR